MGVLLIVVDKKSPMNASSSSVSDKTGTHGGRTPSSGSTATVCVVRNGAELAVAHVGDSRALLCRKAAALPLTEDHEPELEHERERIERCKGRITWSSVGRPRVNGVLEMTRSIGDVELKKCGVTADPDVHVLEVSLSTVAACRLCVQLLSLLFLCPPYRRERTT